MIYYLARATLPGQAPERDRPVPTCLFAEGATGTSYTLPLAPGKGAAPDAVAFVEPVPLSEETEPRRRSSAASLLGTPRDLAGHVTLEVVTLDELYRAAEGRFSGRSESVWWLDEHLALGRARVTLVQDTEEAR